MITIPRVARKKSDLYLYHISSRSISEVDLFKNNEDKDKYLSLLSKYIHIFNCKIYSYCLMDTHVHLFINTLGFDISRFMHCLNTAYVTYYNLKYKRHGHLFQGRFLSSTILNLDQAFRLSAYIHNNPKSISAYFGKEDQYPYSSFGIYTGFFKDKYALVDRGLILGKISKKSYQLYVKIMKSSNYSQIINTNLSKDSKKNIYIDIKFIHFRNLDKKIFIDFLKHNLSVDIQIKLKAKCMKSCSNIRSFTAYILRSICGYTYYEICKFIGNISRSAASHLSSKGYKLITNNSYYKNLYNKLYESVSST